MASPLQASAKMKRGKRALNTTKRRADPRWNDLREPRKGIMLHYDASGSDAGAVQFLLRDPDCKVSYNQLILDDGEVVEVVPDDGRAWHAGVCKPSATVPKYKDANSAFYGLAFASKPGDRVFPEQVAAAVQVAVRWMKRHKWTDVNRHITDHAAEAWPRGRKQDINGLLGITLEEFRSAVAAALVYGEQLADHKSIV